MALDEAYQSLLVGEIDTAVVTDCRYVYFYMYTGPSYALQCSSAGSSVALDEAYQSLLVGEIDTAVVAGCSLDLKDKFSGECEDTQPDGR